jgi:CubicO group peptidase (beta-lactamase class C family)
MVWRAVRYNMPSVTDYKLWQERPVTRAGTMHNFADGSAMGIAPVAEWGLGKWYKPGMTTEDYMKKTGTVAFVVLRGDTLLYEYYGDDFADTSRFNVFSMTKAYMSTLTGIAVGEGKIKSIDQSISEYLPWCIDSAICKITIRDLLQMTSGLKSNEGYLNPWGTSTKMYYGNQMPKIMRDLEVKYAPGTRYFYQNVNSQLLGMIVRRAVGKPLATYLSEKIWEPWAWRRMRDGALLKERMKKKHFAASMRGRVTLHVLDCWCSTKAIGKGSSLFRVNGLRKSHVLIHPEAPTTATTLIGSSRPSKMTSGPKDSSGNSPMFAPKHAQ